VNPLQNNFDASGKVAGDSLSTSDTGAGDQFSGLASVAPKYASGAAHGSLCIEVNNVSGAGGSDQGMRWTSAAWGSAGTHHMGRIYWKVPTSASFDNVKHGLFFIGSDANAAAGIRWNGETRIRVLNAGSSALGFSNDYSQNTWHRLEYDINHTTGEIFVYIFDSLDGTTADETMHFTSASINTDCREVRFGEVGGPDGGAHYFMDSIKVAQTSLPGPDSAAPPVADFTGTPLSGSSPLSVAFTDTSTGGAGTSWHWEKNDGSGWQDFAGTPTAQNPTESFTA
jgi:hypothetical protein